MQISAKIEGLDELLAATKQAPIVAIKEIGKATKRSIDIVHSKAFRESPVNRQSGGGTLRQMIRSKMTSRISGEVSSNANYSIYVHEGTRPHEIRIRNKRVLANKRTGEFFGKRVMHPGTRANPFMQRALNKSIGAINKLFRTAIDNILRSLL